MISKGAIQLLLVLALVASTAWPVFSYVGYKEKADRVKVSLFDETLCPACRMFVKDQLGPTWNKLKDIMEVELVAYGWAEESPMGSGYNFTCQHGPDECVGNMVVECAKAYLPHKDNFIHFAVCFMSGVPPLPPPLTVGRKCAENFGVKWSPIEKCANSIEGQQLLHEAGVKFHSLKDPEPTWVPWILINGTPSVKAEANLTDVVCNTYEGPTPVGCPSP